MTACRLRLLLLFVVGLEAACLLSSRLSLDGSRSDSSASVQLADILCLEGSIILSHVDIDDCPRAYQDRQPCCNEGRSKTTSASFDVAKAKAEVQDAFGETSDGMITVDNVHCVRTWQTPYDKSARE